MTKFSLTPKVGFRPYCYFGGSGRAKRKVSKDELIAMVQNKAPHLHSIDGVIDGTYKYRGSKLSFGIMHDDGKHTCEPSTWGKSGWHFIFVQD